MTDFIRVGKKTDFPLNMATGIEINGRYLCIANDNGRLYALEDQCSHAQSLISGGEVEGGEIACPLHGARFEVASGAAKTLPAVKPVQTFDVKVEGDDVFVKVE